jgi:hypothetical protein
MQYFPSRTDPFLDSEKNFVSFDLRMKCGSKKTRAKAPGIVLEEIEQCEEPISRFIVCAILNANSHLYPPIPVSRNFTKWTPSAGDRHREAIGFQAAGLFARWKQPSRIVIFQGA